MKGFTGIICESAEELKKAASLRSKSNYEESVPHDQVKTKLKQDWQIIRKSKTRTRMSLLKPYDVLFEDRVWMIFYKLGFTCMNADRNFKLKFKVFSKQIDVLAIDKNNIFVIECRSSKSDEVINAKSVLEEYVGKQKDIRNALKPRWGQTIRVNIIVAISSKTKRSIDEVYVTEHKEKNLFLWSKRDLEYIENLIKQVGSIAKYQLYSVILSGKKQKSLSRELLALKCKVGGNTCYSFLMSAKALLGYAYIHHRKLVGIIEATQAYQRMLNSSKLREIAAFVDDGEGFFPNSLIINFTKSLQWKLKEAKGDIELGTVTLPAYYGCAWIIDGQHRLYGVASAKTDIIVPILAFENMDQQAQANLFVDINEKQKKVPKDLLWDLYSDIYRESSDEKQKYLFQIAETAKRMEEYGPLRDIIDIPSVPKKRVTKLSLTTICSTIQQYSPWEHLKHPYDETMNPDNASRIINSYFKILQQLWSEDWAKGNNGVLLTNNGFGVFMMIFQDVVNHIVYKHGKDILELNRKKTFEELLKNEYLKPVIEFLKAEKGMQNDIRTETGRGPQGYNASLLGLKIQEFIPDFSPPRIGDKEPIITIEKEPHVISKIEEKSQSSEKILRKFVLMKLKTSYEGDKWWKHGIPGGPKTIADNNWIKDVKRKPYLSKMDKSKINERKFEYFGLGEISQIMIYGQNWDKIFEFIFLDKDNLQRRINDIKVIRNPTVHQRKLDDQDVADGISGLLWLSKCLGYSELNPYV